MPRLHRQSGQKVLEKLAAALREQLRQIGPESETLLQRLR
jgi:hypothetical protein